MGASTDTPEKIIAGIANELAKQGFIAFDDKAEVFKILRAYLAKKRCQINRHVLGKSVDPFTLERRQAIVADYMKFIEEPRTQVELTAKRESYGIPVRKFRDWIRQHLTPRAVQDRLIAQGYKAVILEWIIAHPRCTTRDLREHTRLHDSTVRWHIRSLIYQGKIVASTAKGRGNVFTAVDSHGLRSSQDAS